MENEEELSTLNQNVESGKKKKLPLTSGLQSPSKSPERCPICLSPPENKAITDTCFHSFCFSCLKEWSKVKVECPLCKSKFRLILYNVVADDNYDEYLVPQPEANEQSDIHERLYHRLSHFNTGVSFGFSDWMLSNMQEWREQLQRRQENSNAASVADTDIELIRRRRSYYRNGTMVMHVDNNKHVRDISSTFYQENPAQLHRLIPWLKRELVVLFGANSMYLVSRLCDLLLDSIPLYGVTSSEFYDSIQPFFGDLTDHFINELISYAKSPHDLTSYDRHAHYARSREHIHTSPSVSDLHSSRLNHAFSHNPYMGALPPPLANAEHKIALLSKQSRNKDLHKQFQYERSRKRKRRDFMKKHTARKSQMIPVPVIVISSSENEDSSQSKYESSSKQNCSASNLTESKSWSSDDDVEIVKFTKPTHLRSPDVIIELSSTDDDKPGPSTSAGVKQESKPPVKLLSSSSDSNSEEEAFQRVKSVIVPVTNPAISPSSSPRPRKLQKVRYCKTTEPSRVKHSRKKHKKRKRSKSSRSSSSSSSSDNSGHDFGQPLQMFK